MFRKQQEKEKILQGADLKGDNVQKTTEKEKTSGTDLKGSKFQRKVKKE